MRDSRLFWHALLVLAEFPKACRLLLAAVGGGQKILKALMMPMSLQVSRRFDAHVSVSNGTPCLRA